MSVQPPPASTEPSPNYRGLVWRFLTHQRKYIFALLATALVTAAADVAFPWLLRNAVDDILEEPATLTLTQAGLGMIVIGVVLFVGEALAIWVEALLFCGASFELRRQIYTHYFSQQLGFFQKHRLGELQHRMSSDVALFEASMIELFSDMPFSLLVLGGVLVVMVFTDPGLTLMIVTLMVVMSIVGERVGRPLPGIRRLAQITGARLASLLQESLLAIRTVKAFANEPAETARLDAANRRLLKNEIRAGAVRGVVKPVWGFAETIGVILVVWYGGLRVIDGQLSVGGMVAFLVYMELLNGPMDRIGGYYYHFQTCRAVGERIQSILAETPAKPSGGAEPTTGATSIRLEHVHFTYPGADRPTLEDASFVVDQGECVALLGRNGAGKSTLLDLILRLYDVDGGRIMVGDLDVAACNQARLRRQIGFMPQETLLFHGTIFGNVAYGDQAATRSDVERALEMVGAAHLIQRLPKGLDTLVGERGTRLSGGERQLIALSRVALRQPRLLLLDEPTAQIDGEALIAVHAALARLIAGRTTLIVSHRRGTLELANRVVVMDGGRIVASGSHEQLSKTSKLYRALLHVTEV